MFHTFFCCCPMLFFFPNQQQHIQKINLFRFLSSCFMFLCFFSSCFRCVSLCFWYSVGVCAASGSHKTTKKWEFKLSFLICALQFFVLFAVVFLMCLIFLCVLIPLHHHHSVKLRYMCSQQTVIIREIMVFKTKYFTPSTSQLKSCTLKKF